MPVDRPQGGDRRSVPWPLASIQAHPPPTSTSSSLTASSPRPPTTASRSRSCPRPPAPTSAILDRVIRRIARRIADETGDYDAAGDLDPYPDLLAQIQGALAPGLIAALDPPAPGGSGSARLRASSYATRWLTILPPGGSDLEHRRRSTPGSAYGEPASRARCRETTVHGSVSCEHSCELANEAHGYRR